MLDAIIDVLQRKAPSGDPGPTAEQIADAIWYFKWTAGSILAPPEESSVPSIDSDIDDEQGRASDDQGEDSEGEDSVTSASDQETPSANTQIDRPGSREDFSSQTSDEGDSSRGLYVPPSVDVEESDSKSVTPLRAPRVRLLDNRLQLASALRPLGIKVPSKTGRLELDERATVKRVAEEGIWAPVQVPIPERWLEATIIADVSPTMSVWSHLIKEFRELLGTTGAFRRVDVWRLDTSVASGSLPLFSRRRSFRRSVEHLLDPTGRRVVFLVSDCVSMSWRDGRVREILDKLGAVQPVAIVQVLHPKRWRMTSLRDSQLVYVRAPVIGSSNRLLRFEGKSSRFPVPILTLKADSLSHWAEMLTMKPGEGSPAYFLNQYFTPPPVHPELSAEERVARFIHFASPTAVELARLFSVTKLRLPIMRIVQDRMMPEATSSQLAEVILGGLLRRTSPAAITNGDLIEFEFYPGVRDELLKDTIFPDAVKVFNITSEFISNRIGQHYDFQVLVDDLSGNSTIRIAREEESFAAIAASLLRRLGGPYRPLAEKLESADIEPLPTGDKDQSRYSTQQLEPGIQAANELLLLTPIKTLQHDDLVFRFAFSPDGKVLAVPSRDGTIRIWNVATGEGLRTIRASGMGVNQVCWSPDGKQLAAACFSRVVRLFDAETGREIAKLEGHHSEVRCVAWSTNNVLATATGRGTVRFWNTQSLQQVAILGLDAGFIRDLCWDVAGSHLGVACARGSFVIAFHPDGMVDVEYSDTIASSSVIYLGEQADFAGSPAVGFLWGTDDGAVVGRALSVHHHKGRVTALSASDTPHKSLLASKSQDGNVVMMERPGLTEVGRIQLSSKTDSPHSHFQFSPDGWRFAVAESGDKQVQLWDYFLDASLQRGRALEIRIVGSSFEQTAERQAMESYCHQFGRVLSAAGHALVISSDFPGTADAFTLSGYLSAGRGRVLFSRTRNPRALEMVDRLRELVPDAIELEVDYGPEGSDPVHSYVLERCDAQLAIGGDRNTGLAIQEAFSKKVPSLSLPHAGGTARASAADSFERLQTLGISVDRFESLRDYPSPADVVALLSDAVELTRGINDQHDWAWIFRTPPDDTDRTWLSVGDKRRIQVNRHAHQLKPGDVIVFWHSGNGIEPGIDAVGAVVSDVSRGEGGDYVDVEYRTVLPKHYTLDRISKHDTLVNHPLFSPTIAPGFRLTREQYVELAEGIADWESELEASESTKEESGDDLVYFNGIDGRTGEYLWEPTSIEGLTRRVVDEDDQASGDDQSSTDE